MVLIKRAVLIKNGVLIKCAVLIKRLVLIKRAVLIKCAVLIKRVVPLCPPPHHLSRVSKKRQSIKCLINLHHALRHHEMSFCFATFKRLALVYSIFRLNLTFIHISTASKIFFLNTEQNLVLPFQFPFQEESEQQ